jgi:hypothetical protein
VTCSVFASPTSQTNHFYLEIILSGSLVGLIVGYATQRWGVAAAPAVLR